MILVAWLFFKVFYQLYLSLQQLYQLIHIKGHLKTQFEKLPINARDEPRKSNDFVVTLTNIHLSATCIVCIAHLSRCEDKMTYRPACKVQPSFGFEYSAKVTFVSLSSACHSSSSKGTGKKKATVVKNVPALLFLSVLFHLLVSFSFSFPLSLSVYVRQSKVIEELFWSGIFVWKRDMHTLMLVGIAPLPLPWVRTCVTRHYTVHQW